VAGPPTDAEFVDRNILITGGNSGIGKEAAVLLGALGAHVGITARDPKKGAAARQEIVERSGHDNVEVIPLDLASLASVRACAGDVLSRWDHLDVLINNAGGTLSKRGVTADGFETTFGVNHLGHFLLTNLLLDRLKASAPARVITVSSVGHKYARGGLDFDDLQCEHERYHGFMVYCRSKLANVLFANELARRLAGTKVTSNSVHPGYVATNFAREGDTGMFGWFSSTFGRIASISPAKGADTVVYLAASPAVDEVTGQYFYKRRPIAPSAAATDEATARRLWEVSEQLVGLSPGAASRN
jgi:NAD(P)-dependent dehydrogenase (short-subunit alcohol dehydrogenase family)